MRRFIALLCLLAACSTPSTPDPNLFRTDEGLPITWRTNISVRVAHYAEEAWNFEIDAAMAIWNASVGRQLLTRTSTCTGDRCILVVIQEVDPNSVATTSCGFKKSTGETRYCLMRLGPELEEDEALRVITHEFGHALGLSHDEDDKQSLMYPASIPGPWSIQPEDAAYVYKTYR